MTFANTLNPFTAMCIYQIIPSHAEAVTIV